MRPTSAIRGAPGIGLLYAAVGSAALPAAVHACPPLVQVWPPPTVIVTTSPGATGTPVPCHIPASVWGDGCANATDEVAVQAGSAAQTDTERLPELSHSRYQSSLGARNS
jgi:hypothetical protein